MKILVTYYSYSGTTERVIHMFKEVLEKKNELKIQRLQPKVEITSFLGQCIAARMKKRCEVDEALFDGASYDTLIIGSPVWAFAPAPAMNTYLDKLIGVNNKKVIVLLTSGSGAGVKMCFKYMNAILRGKGVSDIREINIPNAMMSDTSFIISSLEKVL
jgi:flavodoxin